MERRQTIATTGEQPVRIPAGEVVLDGDLSLGERSRGAVVFAHGSGSSRFSPRNRHVAARLQAAGLATLLMDLLTREEERVDEVTRELRFDIPLLARRLTAAVDWLAEQPETAELPIGTFGASTGAAAALIAAAERPEAVRAVVSRGGRPDLAGDALERVVAPTLLIVGELDPAVLELNRQALARLRGPKALEIVPGATHLFEEPGALEEVARLAAEWFGEHLAGPARSTRHQYPPTPPPPRPS
ncbi:MAG TPA: alpha/beta family hydrolase [Longimicrobiales bacterium]